MQRTTEVADPSAAAIGTGPERPARRKSRRNLALLGAVAVLYTAIQALLVTPYVFLSWDESLYASQFAPGVPPAYMSAPRAYGMAYLIAPVTFFTASVTAIRIYLTLLSGVGLFLAFWPWLRVRDSAAVPLAAFAFSSLWLMVFYGSQIMPNIYIAYGAVAATGLFLLAARKPANKARWWPLAGLGAVLVLIGLLRPTDAVWIAIPLFLGCLAVRAWRRWAPLAVMAGGIGLGILPWVIDSYQRFGGLDGRFEAISEENATGVRFVLFRHLGSLSNEMLVCGAWEDDCGGYSLGVILWWCALPILVLLGLYALRKAGQLRAGLLAVAVAGGIAIPYLLITGHANPRYLLPTYALLSIPAAYGLVRLAALRTSRGWPSAVRPVLVSGVVAVFGAAQLWTAADVADKLRPPRSTDQRVAARLAELGIRPPCFILGNHVPQIAYAAKCRGQGRVAEGLPTGEAAENALRRLEREQRRPDRRVAVLAIEESGPGNFPAGWRVVRLWPDEPWYAHLPPEQ
jgi:hypothetical protein